MAAMESLSSCAPHPHCQPPPPIAHAPYPTGVMFKSELPNRRVSISNLLGRASQGSKVYRTWFNQHERRFRSRVLSLSSAGKGKLTVGRDSLLQSGRKDFRHVEPGLGSTEPVL